MENISTVFSWLNSQLLKMEWLWDLVELLVENVFGLSMESRLGGSVHFFIYDVIKIFILLAVMIFMISYIQSYFPPERTKKLLGKIKGIKGNISGAILGILTPFCICRLTFRCNIFFPNSFTYGGFSRFSIININIWS